MKEHISHICAAIIIGIWIILAVRYFSKAEKEFDVIRYNISHKDSLIKVYNSERIYLHMQKEAAK